MDSIEIRWKGLKQSAKNTITDETINILKGLNGVVNQGECLALMGPSGSGKTSLLNILTLQNRDFKGEISFNGHEASSSDFDQNTQRDMISYIQQEDTFVWNLTVGEHLHFHASLRMSDKSRTVKEERIREVLKMLRMDECQNTRILFLSGGEKKRLAIAEELLNDPGVLICDEPTTGLDSHMADTVMNILQDLSKINKKTVIFSVHQPSSKMFNNFEKVMFLAKGECIYFGSGKDMVEHFKGVGLDCPLYINPCEWILETLSNLNESEINISFPEYKENITVGNSDSEELTKTNMLAVQQETKQQKNVVLKKSQSNISPKIIKKASQLTEQIAIAKRSLLSRSREKLATKLAQSNCLMIVTIISAMMWQMPLEQEYLRSINGLCFFMIIHTAMSSMFEVVMPIVAERPLLSREQTVKRLYRIGPWYLAKTTGEIPIQLSFPLLYSIIQWTCLGYDFLQWIQLVCVMWLCVAAATSFGYFVSTLSNDFNIVLSIAIVTIVPLFLFTGLFSDQRGYSVWVDAIGHLSLFRWAYNAGIIILWYGVDISCSQKGEYASACITSGSQILREQDITDPPKVMQKCIVMLLVLTFSLRFLGYLRIYFRQVYDNSCTVFKGQTCAFNTKKVVEPEKYIELKENQDNKSNGKPEEKKEELKVVSNK